MKTNFLKWLKSLWDKITSFFKKKATFTTSATTYGTYVSKNAKGHTNPVSIKVKNASADTKKVKLFGSSYNLLSNANYNNDESITITPTMDSITYNQILLALLYTPLNICQIYMSKETDDFAFPHKMDMVNKNLFGVFSSKPLYANFDPYQTQTLCLQIDNDFLLDGNCSFEVDVPGNAEYMISFYPRVEEPKTENVC